MKNLVIIAAIGKNRELGVNNDLIWEIPEDLQFFRATTLGHFIVMGQKTYDSMPKNLPNRKYIVISHQPELMDRSQTENLIVFSSIPEFLKFAKAVEETIYVIGGGMIYSQLIEHSHKMILTEINAEFSDAQVYFPQFDKEDWQIQEIPVSTEGNIDYKRNIYTRK